MVNWIDSEAPVFFDTDCLGCFLWTSSLLVLRNLLRDRIHIPEEVVDEIMRRRAIPPAGAKVIMAQRDLKQFIATGKAKVVRIVIGSNEHEEFSRLVKGEFMGEKLGKGESAALVHARFGAGIAASNNLADIMPYCRSYKLPWITATRMLLDAVSTTKMTFDEASDIWERMIQARRRMPYEDFQSAWDNEARCELETAATLDPARTD